MQDLLAWNRIGTKLIPKLRSGQSLDVQVQFTVKVSQANSSSLRSEVQLILEELGLAGALGVRAE